MWSWEGARSQALLLMALPPQPIEGARSWEADLEMGPPGPVCLSWRLAREASPAPAPPPHSPRLILILGSLVQPAWNSWQNISIPY